MARRSLSCRATAFSDEQEAELLEVLERTIFSPRRRGRPSRRRWRPRCRPRPCGGLAGRVNHLDQRRPAGGDGEVAGCHQLGRLLVAGVLDALHQVLRGADLSQRLATVLDGQVGALLVRGWGETIIAFRVLRMLTPSAEMVDSGLVQGTTLAITPIGLANFASPAPCLLDEVAGLGAAHVPKAAPRLVALNLGHLVLVDADAGLFDGQPGQLPGRLFLLPLQPGGHHLVDLLLGPMLDDFEGPACPGTFPECRPSLFEVSLCGVMCRCRRRGDRRLPGGNAAPSRATCSVPALTLFDLHPARVFDLLDDRIRCRGASCRRRMSASTPAACGPGRSWRSGPAPPRRARGGPAGPS